MAMTLKFRGGVGGEADNVATCVENAVAAERDGFDSIGYGDTIFRDFISVLTACALATNRVSLGPTVTNPLTRAPIALANAMATIDEISNGRAFVAIGLGASATAIAGVDRAKPAQMAAAIHTFRSAFRDAPGEDGRTPFDTDGYSIKWAKRKVPVIVHASGPLGLKVAAMHGDGLLLRLGDTDWDQLPGRIAQVRQMHQEGPRAGMPFEVWMMVPMTVGEIDPTSSLAAVVSARANTLRVDQCPPELAHAHQQFLTRYDYKYHASTTEPRNLELLEKLGLTDYMMNRYALSGSAEKLLGQLRRLEAAGVNQVTAGQGPEMAKIMRAYRDGDGTPQYSA
ncbi:MAG: LLM class flavin-dependent oxidoreductase [Rhizorhabdus sp.]